MDYKQVLVVRQKYPDGKGNFVKTRKGKEIAQACHGTVAAVLKNKFLLCESRDSRDLAKSPQRTFEETTNTDLATHLCIPLTEPLKAWLLGIFKKIAVSVDSEQELLDLKQKADQAGILNVLIEDSGLTEFHGVKTKTVLAIGPDASEKIDLITGHLRLL